MKNLLLQAKISYIEKLRRFSFLAMAALCLFASFILVPNSDATRMQVFMVEPNFFKQGTNPTWIPMASAFCLGFILPLFGFAYLKNTISADRESRLLSLYQSSGFSPFPYMFGKFFSGCLILFSFVFIVAMGSAVVSLFRFPGQFLSPIALFSPFLVLLPGLIFTSAAALLFETLPFFRSAKGSTFAILLFFSFFMFTLVLSSPLIPSDPFSPIKIFDISGYNVLMYVINAAAVNAGFQQPVANLLILGSTGEGSSPNGTLELYFAPVFLSGAAILQVFLFLLCSVCLVALAALLLEKSPLPEHPPKKSRKKSPKNSTLFFPFSLLPLLINSLVYASLFLLCFFFLLLQRKKSQL